MSGWPAGLRRLALLGLCCAVVPAALAQDTSGPLTVDELLQVSERSYPMILKSIAARRAAEGRATEAQGAFDLVFSADGFSRINGFYDGTAIEGRVSRRLQPLGASVYAGYKVSDGTFPIYEDSRYTNTGGAVKVGVLFSLLRDRDIDSERFGIADAGFDLRKAELDILLTKVGVQRRALTAYWNWVTVGRQLAVYRNLLRIAIERQDAFEEQIRQGARASIFLTENLQNITRRQILVTRTQRDLAMAANSLSIYYRGTDGRPRVPSPDRLPPGVQLNEIDSGEIDDAEAMSQALAARPELALLRTAIEQEQNRMALEENELKPELDLGVEVQSGLGGVAEGGPSRDSTDTVVGFSFSVPLERRAARGQLEQTRAELEEKRLDEQFRREQVEIEVRNLLIDLRVARDLLYLAAQEVQQSEIMRAAELRRFQSGASDFFLVNVREETAADARVKLNEAELAIRLARANYDAATMNVERLRIKTETFETSR